MCVCVYYILHIYTHMYVPYYMSVFDGDHWVLLTKLTYSSQQCLFKVSPTVFTFFFIHVLNGVPICSLNEIIYFFAQNIFQNN